MAGNVGGNVVKAVGGAVGGAVGTTFCVGLALGGWLVVGKGLKLNVGSADALGLTLAIAEELGLGGGPWAGRLSRMKITAPTSTTSTKPRPAASS